MHRVGGRQHASDRAGANTAGEGVSSSASLLRPDPGTAVSGHDGEGSRFSAGVSQVYSRGLPRPEIVPADEDCLNDPQRKEADFDEKESGQKDLRLDPDVEVAAGSGSGHEAKQASSPPPVTPIPCKKEPDSTWTLSPQLPRLIIRLDNTGTSVVRDQTPQEVLPNEKAEPGAATNEKKSGWKMTAFATAKLLLRGVRDSADAFGPLKSVAGGLCFILENCEVWSSPCVYHHSSYTCPSE